MATYRDHGIVLRSRALREADRQYLVFTERHGKVALIGRGVRRSKSKMSPHLGGFGVVDVMVANGRKYDRLAGAGLISSFRGISASLEKSAAAQGLLVTVDALTRRDLPEPKLFALLRDALAALDRSPAESGRPLLFDAACVLALDLLGVGLELDACVRCRSPLVPEGNGMSVIRGGIECANCRSDASVGISATTIKSLRFFRREPIALVPSLRLSAAVRQELSFIVDLLLTAHLEGRYDALRFFKALAL